MSEYSLSRQRRDYEDALPIPCADTRSEQVFGTYLAQHQSPLLSRLPIEIRLHIWQYAIGDQAIHIINKYRRLGHAIMDDEYWHQHHAERPSLRACSWIYTYGALPTTKQLADNNLCDLLVACRQIYQEAVAILYSTNTFVFWDIRTVTVFARCIPLESWKRIRSVEVYAMFYREDDMNEAVEARSLLQLETWPKACSTLATMPDLRILKVHLTRPKYLDQQHLIGNRGDVGGAILEFVRKIKVKAKLEVYMEANSRAHEAEGRCGLKVLEKETQKTLEEQLQEEGINCKWLCCTEEMLDQSVILGSSVNIACVVPSPI